MMTTNTNRSHRYDLLKPDIVRDPRAELDWLSLSRVVDDEEEHVQAAPPVQPEVIRYDSLFELREQWKRLDQSEFALQLTVVLFLQQNFNGHLAGLIRRRNPALRLLIASPTGQLPGMVTIGDLALHSASLGWHLISFHRNAADAVAGAMQPMTWQERCVMFQPVGTDYLQATGEVVAPVWERRWM